MAFDNMHQNIFNVARFDKTPHIYVFYTHRYNANLRYLRSYLAANTIILPVYV